MGYVRVRLAVAVGAAAAVTLGLLATGTAVADEGVESVPVEFDVVTSNRTGVPCVNTPTEKTVTVRGHLTGPASELSSDSVDGAMYVHGNGYGEFFWRYRKDDDYNLVKDMAERGHVSLTIDRVGYLDSDRPNGNGICFGTEADVVAQIIGQLRDGDYDGDYTPRFDRVALLGHSAGGIIVNQAAYAFGDIDALGIVDSGGASSTPLVAQRAGEMQLRCLTATDGYAPLEANDQQFRDDHIFNVEDDIADDLTERRTDDACAGTRNAGQAIASGLARSSTIDVPVLVILGEEDRFFQNPERQAMLYTGSPEVTVREIPDAGHAIAFARTAPQFRDEVASWLEANDF